MDLLTTYTHHLELQVITVLLLIFTLYSSLLHPLRFSSLLCLNHLFPGNGFVEIFQHPSFRLLSQPPMQNSCQFPHLPTVNSGTWLSTVDCQPTALSQSSNFHLERLSQSSANSGTLSPILCRNCQLSRCHLFSVIFDCRFSTNS
jgi:hypothetical protein